MRRFIIVMSLLIWASPSHAQSLAQECADQMARTGRFAHMGFGPLDKKGHCVTKTGRCARGSGAEIIAIAKTEAGAIRLWLQSPRHAEIYARGVSIASAKGKRYTYWCGVNPG